jgi:hypothetical protein
LRMVVTSPLNAALGLGRQLLYVPGFLFHCHFGAHAVGREMDAVMKMLSIEARLNSSRGFSLKSTIRDGSI